jgi:hypothetical protein
MTIISFTDIYNITKFNGFEEQEIDEELEEELEELADIDIRKFGAGLSIVNNLISILFLCYCAFFLKTVLLKGMVVVVCALSHVVVVVCVVPVEVICGGAPWQTPQERSESV